MSASITSRLHSARFHGAFPQVRTPRYVIVGQDGGQSIRAGDQTLFLFSDTLLLASAAPGERTKTSDHFLANCAAISNETNLESALASLRYYHGEDSLPREILPANHRDRFRRVRFWPEHGIFLNDRVYFYYLGVQTTGVSSVWQFRTVGAGLAEFDIASGAARRIEHRGDWVLWRNPTDDLHFGVYVVAVDEHVYVFGSSRTGVQSTAWLARVPADRIAERDAYEYLASTDPTWTPDISQACSLGPAAAEFSANYNAYLEMYTMIYLDEYSKRLKLRTADQLWGPYSEPTDLIGVPHQDDSLFVYLGFEHAGFQRENGRKIFVSYCEPHFAASSLLSVTFDNARSG